MRRVGLLAALALLALVVLVVARSAQAQAGGAFARNTGGGCKAGEDCTFSSVTLTKGDAGAVHVASGALVCLDGTACAYAVGRPDGGALHVRGTDGLKVDGVSGSKPMLQLRLASGATAIVLEALTATNTSLLSLNPAGDMTLNNDLSIGDDLFMTGGTVSVITNTGTNSPVIVQDTDGLQFGSSSTLRTCTQGSTSATNLPAGTIVALSLGGASGVRTQLCLCTYSTSTGGKWINLANSDDTTGTSTTCPATDTP